jgi:microcystin-dependent protein
MAEPFLSEIRILSFVFAPKDWALCNGLGTTFGGDGQ